MPSTSASAVSADGTEPLPDHVRFLDPGGGLLRHADARLAARGDQGRNAADGDDGRDLPHHRLRDVLPAAGRMTRRASETGLWGPWIAVAVYLGLITYVSHIPNLS